MASKAAYKALKVDYQDIDRMVVEDDKEVENVIDAQLQKSIIKQVNDEYKMSFKFNEAKRATNLARLRLYNNQKRDDDAVGDPLMFTVFNTIHAALYDDRLMVNWEGRGGSGDEDVEENLNALAEFDYAVMDKSKTDYYWNWDAEFFGRGLLLMMDFDRSDDVMAPIPELLDAATFIRDPRATSVNGDMKGKGSMRFGGWEVGATYYEMKKLSGYFNLKSLRKDKEVRSLLQEAQEARSLAQGTTPFEPDEEGLGKYANYEFKLLNWMTSIKGKKYLVTLGNSRSVIVRLTELKYNDKWPIIDRPFYPMSNDWDGVSIPDLTEDKQRAKAILINLGVKSAIADAIPQYIFNKDKIKNLNDLNVKSQKYIGVNGDTNGAIVPMNKATVHQYVGLIMDMLDGAAQKATATPEIQQGIVSSKQRTLGELELVSSKVDTRYSMSAKIYGWSERSYWRQYYVLYKKHFKDEIDEKIIRIQGALAPEWRPLTRENIISTIDPDVRIESKVISEGKRQRDQQAFAGSAQLAIQNPENDRRYIEKKAMRLAGSSKEEIDAMFPPTIDEIQAGKENEILDAKKLPKISIDDNHQVHRQIHGKANQNAYSVAHIRAHEKLMIIKRDRQDLFQQQQPIPVEGQGQQQQQNSPPASPAPTTPTQ